MAEESFSELLERSSLSEENLWVQCPTHGRQPTDPFKPGRQCLTCVMMEEADGCPND